MASRTELVAIISAVAAISACNFAFTPVCAGEKDVAATITNAPSPFCAARGDGATWCEVDFNLLALYGRGLNNSRIFITGYVVVDNGIVSVYPTEQEYELAIRSRSVEVQGSRDELKKLINENGYQYIRIEATFRPQPLQRGRTTRLGVLYPPFKVRQVQARTKRDGAEDILVEVNQSVTKP